MKTDTMNVAIVGDHPVSRAGMEKLVSDDPALQVSASVPSIHDLTGTFDIVILDLPLRDPISTLDVIATAARMGRPLISSPWEGAPTLVSAIRSGAVGLISRHTEQESIREALRTVAHGGFYMCPTLLRRFQAELSRPHDEDPNGLAPREIETLGWIAMGFTHSQIATRMGLSQATVNTYAKRIRAKLNVSNKAELTRKAIELGHLPAAGRHPTGRHPDRHAVSAA